MAIAANLGFPRIGADRELKKALESYWKGNSNEDELMAVAKSMREQNWKRQQERGIEHIPSNDFSFYDQVLDHTFMFGAIPERYASLKDGNPLDLYFAMARGRQADGVDVVAMEMTKWFDTNYHYIVPEFEPDQNFELRFPKAVYDYEEAKAAGVNTRPVVIGPVTFLMQGKMRKGDGNTLSLLPKLLPVYAELFKQLEAAGAEWIQIDEPYLAMDLNDEQRAAYASAYAELEKTAKGSLKWCLATYFEGLRDNMKAAFDLPVDAVHVDLKRAPGQLDDALNAVKDNQMLSLGVIDGRNIWKNDLNASLDVLKKAEATLGKDRVMVAPSCSLLHSPVDLSIEDKLDAEIKDWMAFATQKLEEIQVLSAALNDGDAAVADALAQNAKSIEARRTSSRIHNDAVKARIAALTSADAKRASAFAQRIEKQEEALSLPMLPTTTIGSFPQTQEVRQMRAKHKKGDLSQEEYDAYLSKKIEDLISWQDEIGIDVPVHGEFERNDMVEYFGEQLEGYTFTKNGWVQSYGSRCVKPPVIFGDVSRPKPMTVRWSSYAQSLTKKPVKGMLTGPVTMLQWAFVRDDQPREMTCKQIALAIRDEVKDLETAGIHVIQIDEPAFREGLPMRMAERPDYLQWAVESFRISSAGIEDTTQIHTHMCYSEFNDIIDSIADLDADVISIETSRSAMELLDAFVEFKYPNQIGPGVYDIHSPRIPKQEEMTKLMEKALDVLEPSQVWVNPDCGLKTRGWPEVKGALSAMVATARELREQIESQKAA